MNNDQTIRPSSWWYGLAGLVLVFGCLIAAGFFSLGARDLQAAMAEAYDLDRLTQVVVPGSVDLTLAKTGVYAVYYEYRSVVDGVVYARSETPPALVCTLTSQATGADAGGVPDYVQISDGYASNDGQRVGVLIRSLTIDEPGTYTFSGRYADGRSQPEIVLTVGPNFAWELLGIVVVRTVVMAAAGLATLLGSGAVAAVVVFVIAVKRAESEG